MTYIEQENYDFNFIRKDEADTKIITCNCCGKQIVVDNTKHWFDAESFQFMSVLFNEDSQFANQLWSWYLCEDCLLKIIRTFKYVPEGFMQENIYKSALDPQSSFEKWKETGVWDPCHKNTTILH